MSLVPTYVKFSDGLWRKNPVLYGDWGFLCFDDDDPVEVVVWRKGMRKEEARKVVSNLPFVARILGTNNTGQRLVPPYYREFQSAYSFWVSLRMPLIMGTSMLLHDGEWPKRPPGECVYYDEHAFDHVR